MKDRVAIALALLVVAGLAGPATSRAASGPAAGRAAPAGGIAAVPRGVVRVLAHIPAPGYPALPLVYGGDIYEGTYTASTGSSAHSHVFAFSAAGTQLNDWTIADQPTQPYGVQVANTTADGRLVLLDDTSGRVLLMNIATGQRTLYATIPDIPSCGSPGSSSECSQDHTAETPEPDYAAWGPDGSLYVTDYQQAVIWRIPPHGGTPSIWLGGADENGELFGTAGIWMEPDHRTMLFDQASNLLGGGGVDESVGRLYSVPILPDGAPGTPTLLWTSAPATLPDGFAVARSGDIYLAQIGPSGNDVVELSPAGQLLATFGTPVSGANGSSVPFDEPSGVAYFDSDLIVANQSYLSGNSAHQALLALGTGELGQRVYVPADAGPVVPARAVTAPTKPRPKRGKTKRRVVPHPRKRHRHGSTRRRSRAQSARR